MAVTVGFRVANRHADTRLQTRLTPAGLQKRLLDLFYDARTLEEEQGVNILFLALGTLRWIDPNNPANVRFAPLILVPVSLERGNAAEKFKLKWRQEDVSSNLSLEAYLKDPTGGRRFWPARCRRVDVEGLTADRDQLWAEAQVRYDHGEAWWLDTPELLEMADERQKERYQGDPWEDLIDAYLDDEGHQGVAKPITDVSVAELLGDAIHLERSRWGQSDMNRVVRCLAARGFEKYRPSRDGRKNRYRKTP
jgi:hypothetical protein